MSDRTYMLAVDATCGFGDLERIRQYIATSSDFSAWWNHLPFFFLLESQLGAESIAEKLHTLSPDGKFLLTEVSLSAAQGWLPELSWKWIEKRAMSSMPQQSARF